MRIAVNDALTHNVSYLVDPYGLDAQIPGAVGEMEKGLRFGEPNAFLHLHLTEAYKKVGRKAA